ncbi:MAG: RtcB family protein [Candidatus Pacearchaeota archaeon]
MEIKKINDFVWEIEKKGNMNVPCRIFASKKILDDIKEDNSLNQLINVSKLPGIINYSLAMPDIHEGYGFCIGGVAAFDSKEGVVSPGGVGFDINCGVRVLLTNIKEKDFALRKQKILDEIYRRIPTGLGQEQKLKLSEEELNNYLIYGAEHAIRRGFGEIEDLEYCEENGKIENANPSKVSLRAKKRGKPQLGTLGSGNHFIEIQKISEIYNLKVADAFGLEKNNICIMIHCGSRGLGHQIASDYIQKMQNPGLKDKQLAYANLNSTLAKDYFSAMNCAVNFAFANRQIIMHEIRNILKKEFPNSKNVLLYDVCHNIAKFEEHKINNQVQKVCIHRKGATRSFGPSKKLPLKYQQIGQPVIIPGSMGTSSYILVGTDKSETLSFSTTAHGAGRLLSRTKAKQILNPKEILDDLNKKNIQLKTASIKNIIDEAPEAYKNIDEVIHVCDTLNLSKKVAKLIPLAVIKG